MPFSIGRPTAGANRCMLVDALGYGVGLIAVASGWETVAGDPLHPALGIWVVGYAVGAIGAPIVHFARERIGIGVVIARRASRGRADRRTDRHACVLQRIGPRRKNSMAAASCCADRVRERPAARSAWR